VNSPKKKLPYLKAILALKATLLTLKAKSTEQEDGNPVDFLWNHTANALLMIGKVKNRTVKAA